MVERVGHCVATAVVGQTVGVDGHWVATAGQRVAVRGHWVATLGQAVSWLTQTVG